MFFQTSAKASECLLLLILLLLLLLSAVSAERAAGEPRTGDSHGRVCDDRRQTRCRHHLHTQTVFLHIFILFRLVLNYKVYLYTIRIYIYICDRCVLFHYIITVVPTLIIIIFVHTTCECCSRYTARPFIQPTPRQRYRLSDRHVDAYCTCAVV